ncbi:MAG: site-specific integrase, partial [bacterium]|nr:site-specific integrase [bacterium]
VATGMPISLRVERITVDELLDDVLLEYEVNNKNLERAKLSVSKLKAYFGGMRASQITTTHVNAYITKRRGMTTRRGGPPADASVNRELEVLKRAFRLAKQSTPPKVHQVPYIPLLREDNTRTGFVEHADFLALKASAPDYLKPIITMAFCVGARRAEILSLRWPQVDLNRRLIRLNPGETKNRDGRTLYMGQELYDELGALRAARDWQRPHCNIVFTRNGEPIKRFDKAWHSTCKRVGLEGLLFHDLRRSAIRNMIRAGVPQATAMRISGHRTAEVFRRYDIVSEADLEQAAHAVDAYHASVGTISGTIEDAEAILKEAQATK